MGLGNPGKTYSSHRHNLGFMTVDRLAEQCRGGWVATRFDATVCDAHLAGETVLLVKPQTYMNLSGKAVSPVMHRYKGSLPKLMAIHDDLDLEFGRIRIKVGGGDGGHKGVRSIADSLRFKDFIRIRLGIGRPPTGVEPESFVLTPFAQEETRLLEDFIERACGAVRLVIEQGVDRAQNQLHTTKAPTLAGS